MDLYYDKLNDMIGYYPSCYMKYCWKFITPLVGSVSSRYAAKLHQTAYTATHFYFTITLVFLGIIDHVFGQVQLSEV